MLFLQAADDLIAPDGCVEGSRIEDSTVPLAAQFAAGVFIFIIETLQTLAQLRKLPRILRGFADHVGDLLHGGQQGKLAFGSDLIGACQAAEDLLAVLQKGNLIFESFVFAFTQMRFFDFIQFKIHKVPLPPAFRLVFAKARQLTA